MSEQRAPGSIEIYSTCPPSSNYDPECYLQLVADVARWSDECGCAGILIYSDNSLVDPWLVAQIVLQNTKKLRPLVAVQPVYMHPYWVAKKVASLGYLHRRRVDLNMVAGGFKNDLTALDDSTPHDERYARMIEYTTIIKQLLSSKSPVSFEGKYYKIGNPRMTPPLPQNLLPGILMSGSSEAGVAAAKATSAVAIKYPSPAAECEPPDEGIDAGIRVGVIARESEDIAWKIAHERFPEDRKGQLAHQLAMKTSDSVWHKQVSELAEKASEGKNPYWLVPFQNYKTFCPYLVGTYERVAKELASYIAVGYKTFILDVPPNEEELRHTKVVFHDAMEQAKQSTFA